MRPIQYETSYLETLFHRQRIATLPELKGALGTDVYITVLRKLRGSIWSLWKSKKGVIIRPVS